MRVLLLADVCNPEWASLPSVGYNACRAIAGEVQTVLATHVRNKAAIERNPIPGAQVVFVNNEYIASPLYRAGELLRGGNSAGWTTGMAMSYPSYLAFEWEVWKRFGKQLHRGEFDLVHRVTPMSPAIASPMASWSPVPFVLGPLNGGLKWPAWFAGERKREKEWMLQFRELRKLLPYSRSTFSQAAAILAGFSHTIQDLPQDISERVIDFPEVGINPQMFQQAACRSFEGKLTFFFAGRLVPVKCADVLLEAFGQSEALRRHRLVIVGDGPERPRLEQIAREKKLEGCVELLGWRSQAEVGRLMRQAHVFAFPSIKELGAGVVVEAMACGLASVVVDYGGPGGLIRAESGIKVALAPKEQLAIQFAKAMEWMASHPEQVRSMGQEAHTDAIAHYSWEAKAKKIVEIYRWVLGSQKDKPAFGRVAA